MKAVYNSGIVFFGNTHSHIVYDPIGRMTDKQADGQTVFANASFAGAPVPPRPHALKSAESPNGIFPAARQDITYTAFDKVKTLAEGNNTLAYTYGYDRQRIFMEEHANGTIRTKRYVGGCEFVTLTENNTTTEKTLTYLSSPIGIFAVVETVGNDENLHYILKDHLGSWTTITDCQGNIEQELSFDAWGNRRNPETWHSYSQLPEPMFDRGFTGHEHLYAFGLINMNGRMYDPLMSSFLSVDAYVQSPDNSQNFNRYAYCLNNPLKYTDPTGWRMEGGYMGNTTQGPSGWGTNLAPAYEPRDLGRLQLPEYDELAWWREGNKMDGGGSVPIIDPSEMTEEQQQTFNNSIEYSCENSSLFRIMYEILENSPVIYKILIGETKDGCAGQFDPNDKSITFRDDCSLSHFFTYSEELFHAFQDENEKLYNEEIEHNYEYEAKVAKFFMFAQFFSVMNVVGNDSFTFTVNYFCPNGIDIYMPTAQTITDSYFLNGYFEGARRFAEWNRLYNPDKTNYQKNSLQNPVSLIRLFK